MNTYGLEKIKTFDKLLPWLGKHLDWPIDKFDIGEEPFDSLTFEYDAATDLGLKKEDIAHIREIHQLRPFVTNQPWGIFFVSLEDKKIPVGVLKRILGGLTLKKRQSANKADRPGWALHDLLFISAHGKSGERELSFLHFAEENGGKRKVVLKELGWGQQNTALKLEYVANMLKSGLAWPEDEDDSAAWREQWGSAFTSRYGSTIATARDLTARLATLATNIRTSANDVLAYENKNGPLTTVYDNFKEAIFHNLSPDDFADMYAQTISYGLLAASIMHSTSGTLRGLAADDAAMIAPLTQPFLKDLMETFLAVGGRKSKIDFNELGINEVVEALDDADMEAVLRDFGNRNPHEDPILHFYEHFLRDYDSILRQQRGVYYTPLPVVRFIVRSVDEVLQKEFGLDDGLADTATWRDMFRKNPEIKIPDGVSPDEPFVQILDPAAGTGTFLVEVIGLIEDRLKTKWRKEGYRENEVLKLWNKYVSKHLLPRLNGFELMMAPYAIAHIKIGLKLHETGYRPKEGKSPRVRVYLTNTLEEPTGVGAQATLHFITDSLALEAKGADEIKSKTPLTVIIGNPPYSASKTEPEWILELLVDWKKGLNETKCDLNREEWKFIRFAQHHCDSLRAGVLGFITNRDYLDGITKRKMRENLQESFKSRTIVDLHGDVKGNISDQNVFDIQQGVAISILSTGQNNKKHLIASVTGNRGEKFHTLADHSKISVLLKNQTPISPYFRWTFSKSQNIKDNVYMEWDSIPDLFGVYSSGIQTKKDHLCIQFSYAEMWKTVTQFAETSPELARAKYVLGSDGRDWTAKGARSDLRASGPSKTFIQEILYRPFDKRYTYWTGKTKGFLAYPRREVMQNVIGQPNVGLLFNRQIVGDKVNHFGVSNLITCHGTFYLGNKGQDYFAPLFLKPLPSETELRPNIKIAFANKIAARCGLSYSGTIKLQPTVSTQATTLLPDPKMGHGNLAKNIGPRDIFDYIYAVLQSPTYRTRYADFLKQDFPRVPIPSGADFLRELIAIGNKLVALHLLDESREKALANPATRFVGKGEARVEKGFPKYENGKVMINAACWFEDVTPDVWDFHNGGYQVCNKWLKDRAGKGGKNPHPGRVLSDEDILHYRRITVALKETIRIMKEIDAVIEKHGGWPGAFATGDGE